MPNWCENKLTLETTDIDSILKFYNNNFEESQLVFSKELPIPEDYLQNDKWYDWCIYNWGTKWDPQTHFYIDNYTQLVNNSIQFMTAWTPPTNWLLSVSNKYPNITFHLNYAEPGCDFSGILKIKNGSIIHNLQGNAQDYGINLLGESFFINDDEDEEQFV